VQSEPQRTSCNDAMCVGVVGFGPSEPEQSGGAKTNVVGTQLENRLDTCSTNAQNVVMNCNPAKIPNGSCSAQRECSATVLRSHYYRLIESDLWHETSTVLFSHRTRLPETLQKPVTRWLAVGARNEFALKDEPRD